MTRKEWKQMTGSDEQFFMKNWEDYFAKNPGEGALRNALAVTSPHHPNSNMVWLHDRILIELAGLKFNPTEGKA